MKSELATHSLTTVPANVADATRASPRPTSSSTRRSPTARRSTSSRCSPTTSTTASQNPTFRARYESLSTRADFIVYNGHAGLGSNIRALASAGKWVAGQYVVVFMNGCDTFAYVDGSLSQAHKAVNPDDTTGWKYIDIVNNGEPAFFASMAGATMAMFRGLLALRRAADVRADLRARSTARSS